MSNTERLCGTRIRISDMELLARGVIGCGGDVFTYARHIKDIPEKGKQTLPYLFKITSIPYLFRLGLGMEREVFRNNQGMGVFAAVAAYYEAVSVWDDAIDASGATITEQELKIAGKDLVTKIVEVVKASPAPEDQKRAFFHDFHAFRRKEYRLYLAYQESRGKPMTFEETKKYKEETLGLNVETGLKLCLLFVPPIDREKFLRAQSAVIAANLALQIGDDINDYRIDERQGVANFMSAAINEYPEEKIEINKLLQSGCNKIGELRIFAPKTFALLDKTALEYFKQIPPEQNNLKTSAIALLKLYYRKIKPEKITETAIN